MRDNVFIFIGSYCGSENYDLLANKYFKKNISVSNSEYERMLFNGFHELNYEAFLISAPNVGRFPISCKKMRVSNLYMSHDIVSCNYSTIYGISNISKTISLKRNFVEFIRKKDLNNKKVTVIACEAHLPYLKVLKLAKKKFGFKTGLIVPDLPENMRSGSYFIYKFLKSIDVANIYKIANKYCDSFMFFTEQIKNKFNTVGKKSLIREGVIEDFKYTKTNNDTIKCSYIGKVNEINGISLIIAAAFRLPQIDFEIFGSGDMEDELLNCKLKNVKYSSFINPLVINEYLNHSDILLSPRFPNDYTSASFPSKILKYISSGKPIVTFRLPCYSKKYDDIFCYIKNIDSYSLIDAILGAKEIINKDRTDILKTKLGNLLVKNVVKDFVNILLSQ